jgi:multicomponent K+:H+ antiporter subunit G
LLASGIFAVIGGIGILRLRQFFDRMHPPALASTLGAWCAALASVVYFSALEAQLALYPLIVNLLLAITTPVTTVPLARAGLLRKRVAGAAVPPPLGDAPTRREP